MTSVENDDDFNFEEQIRLCELEKQGKLKVDKKTKMIDDTEYEWDETKKAWFPKMSDDFLAIYQATYGVNQNASGKYVYLDPTTKREMLWKEEEKIWVFSDNQEPVVPSASIPENNSNIKYDSDKKCFIYLDSLTKQKLYEYNQQTNSWNIPTNESKPNENNKKKRKKRKLIDTATDKDENLIKQEPKPPEWFKIDDSKNTNVYVSNLPDDITFDEFNGFMSKCGIIMEDPTIKKPKIKLYTDEEGNPKGDGRCCYLKIESVNLALQILDGSYIRDKEIKVERAKFELKGEFNPQLKPKKLSNDEKMLKNKALMASIKKQEKLLAWKPDPIPGQRFNREKTIVIQNLFDPKIFETDPGLIIEYQNNLKKEAFKYGQMKKVRIYDRHQDGIATITFNEFDQADLFLESVNDKMFMGVIITAIRWDGKTKYKVKESEEELEKRLQKWNEYLEENDDEDGEETED